MNKNHFLMMLGLATATGLLGGCAAYPDSVGINAPSAARTQALKGRPFVVGKVTTSPNVKGSPHCLTGVLYAKLLKHDLKKTFAYYKDGQGQGKPIPVNVTIKFMQFNTNLGGWHGSEMAAMVHYGPFKTVSNIGTGGTMWTLNEGPGWTRERRLIPALSIVIGRAIHNIHNGYSYTHGFPEFAPVNSMHYVNQGYTPTNYDGVLAPMPESLIEKVTGKTKRQLTQICDANK